MDDTREINDLLLKAREIANTEPDDAMRMVSKVLNKDLHNSTAVFLAAYILMQADRAGLAYHMFSRCHDMTGDDPRLLSNMASCVDDRDIDLAFSLLDRAAALDPENSAVWANMGLMHLKNGEHEKAEKYSRKALKCDPELQSAKDNLSLSLLAQRKWKEGWDLFRYGLGSKHRKRIDFGYPDWDGETDGHVIVYGEQGIGDEIMFASCIPDAMEKAKVTIECDKRLEGLFKRSFGCGVSGTRYGGELKTDVQPTHQCSIGDLPRFYRNKHKDFPGTPYLKADPERCLQWRALLDQYPGKKIGIAWSGGLDHTGKKRRSINIDDFAPLFDSKHTFVSLEYKTPDQKDLDKYGVLHWDRAVAKGVDYDETCALINELDLVISVCTTVIYGAGGLGKDCWVLVPSHPSYRYHRTGDLPWFKSCKSIRQEGEWSELIKQVKTKLDNHFPEIIL